ESEADEEQPFVHCSNPPALIPVRYPEERAVLSLRRLGPTNHQIDRFHAILICSIPSRSCYFLSPDSFGGTSGPTFSSSWRSFRRSSLISAAVDLRISASLFLTSFHSLNSCENE